MIDEKKLIDRIRHDIRCYEADMMKDHDLYVRVADMIHMIEGQPKINKWIPVEERLPEHDGLYLVCMDDEFIASVEYTTSRDGNQDWELWDESGEVAAWMPLPEPYRPENLEFRR